MRTLLIIICMTLSAFMMGQGDCPGTCNTAMTGAYSAAAGSVAELTAATKGCLTAGEANASFWLRYCFTTAGTFQFSINPSGNRNDFDFAIWNTSTCPPTSAPIRCSYAAVPSGGPCSLCDYTGLGTNPNNNLLAVDVSEGVGGDGYLAPLTVVAGQCITLNINNFGTGSNSFSMDLAGTTAILTCILLPIELLAFEGSYQVSYNNLTWSTATETNCDYFTLERSVNAIDWTPINKQYCSGNSLVTKNYAFRDYTRTEGIDYYRLSQTDYDGTTEYFNIVAVSGSMAPNKKVVKTTNILGQEIDDNARGFFILYYEDGSVFKGYRN